MHPPSLLPSRQAVIDVNILRLQRRTYVQFSLGLTEQVYDKHSLVVLTSIGFALLGVDAIRSDLRLGCSLSSRCAIRDC